MVDGLHFTVSCACLFQCDCISFLGIFYTESCSPSDDPKKPCTIVLQRFLAVFQWCNVTKILTSAFTFFFTAFHWSSVGPAQFKSPWETHLMFTMIKISNWCKHKGWSGTRSQPNSICPFSFVWCQLPRSAFCYNFVFKKVQCLCRACKTGNTGKMGLIWDTKAR